MRAGTQVRLALVNAVAFSPSTVMPLWLGGIAHAMHMPAWFAGVAVLAQIGGAALFNLLAPVLLRDAMPLPVARLALMIAAAGYLLAAVPSPVIFLLGCLISGSAMGVVLNVTNRLMGSAEHVQQGYAIFVMIEVCFACAMFLVGAALIARFGLFSLFAAVSATVAAACALLARLPVDRAVAIAAAPIGDRARAILALGAFGLFFIGQSALNAFMPTIGVAAGFGVYGASRAIGYGMIFALLGAGLARLIGERVEPFVPIIAVVLVLAGLGPALTLHPNAPIFLTGIVVLGISTMFSVPYFFAQLGALDRGGRYAAFGPAMMLSGIALGPSIAVLLDARFGLFAVGLFATTLVLLGGAGTVMAAPRRRSGGETGISHE